MKQNKTKYKPGKTVLSDRLWMNFRVCFYLLFLFVQCRLPDRLHRDEADASNGRAENAFVEAIFQKEYQEE